MSAALYINECCFSAAAQGDFIVEGSECMSADSVNHRLHIKINKEVLVNVGIGDKFRSMGWKTLYPVDALLVHWLQGEIRNGTKEFDDL